MKKIIIILILLCPFLQIKSQTTPWISQGATWHYSWWVPGYGGNDKIEYTHDTILLGKTCQILKTTSYLYGNPGPGLPPILFSTQSLANNYTFNNGDTVFYLNNNQFNVLYNFGAQVNDSWSLGIDTNGFLCSKSIVSVDSISSQQINSNSHRVLYTSDSANSSVGVTGKIIEHIGSLNYLFPTGRSCDSQTVVDFAIYTFSCFQDNTMSYKLSPTFDCENPYHVGIIELTDHSNEIQILSNPVEEKLNITFSKENNYQIYIYNLLGEKLIETKNQKNKSVDIDMSNLNSGVYIATFESQSGEIINKRIIKK